MIRIHTCMLFKAAHLDTDAADCCFSSCLEVKCLICGDAGSSVERTRTQAQREGQREKERRTLMRSQTRRV